MAFIDYNLVMSEDQAISAASTNSNAVMVGKGKAYDPLLIDVKLTNKMTSGKIDTITVQTASDSAFTSPITLCAFSIGTGIDQTARSQTLMQLMVPYEHLDYIRLVYAATSPVGGKVFASINREVRLA